MSTRVETFFPYTYLEKSLSLSIDKIIIDGVEKHHLIDQEKLNIDLISIDWKKISLSISVHISGDDLLNTLNENESVAKDIQVIAALSCKPTRFRKGYKFIPQKPECNIWNQTIELQRDDFSGKLELVVYAVRDKVSALGNIETATSYGDRLASSQFWSIYVDEKSFIPGKTLPIKWEDFRFSEDLIRKKYSEMIYSLDLGNTVPVLYLNKSINGLEQILHEKNRNSPSSKVRDIIFDLIAQPVWMELIIASSLSSKTFDELDDWQKETLKFIASDIFQDEEDDEFASQKLINVLRGEENNTKVIEQIVLVLQNKLRINKTIENYSKTSAINNLSLEG